MQVVGRHRGHVPARLLVEVHRVVSGVARVSGVIGVRGRVVDIVTMGKEVRQRVRGVIGGLGDGMVHREVVPIGDSRFGVFVRDPTRDGRILKHRRVDVASSDVIVGEGSWGVRLLLDWHMRRGVQVWVLLYVRLRRDVHARPLFHGCLR